jgi:hypothetical protein
MATTVNIDTNFIGEVAGEYVAEMIKEANTIRDGLVTVLPNLTSPVFVRKIKTDDGFVNYSCGFDPAGEIAISEKELAPKKIKEDRSVCKEDFRQLWTSAQMGLSAHNDRLPATEQAAILADIGRRLARKIDTEIWNGAGGAGELNGFIPALLTDVDVLTVDGIAITPTNVEAEVAKFIAKHEDEFFQSSTWKFGVSTNVIRALRRAYGKEAIANGTFLNPNEFAFDGYTLTEVKGLPANTMVGYDSQNLFFGTALLSDHTEIRIKDMDESDLSGTVRTKIVLTGGVQYAYGGEVVLYTIPTPSA